jgi:hypothetical protein
MIDLPNSSSYLLRELKVSELAVEDNPDESA